MSLAPVSVGVGKVASWAIGFAVAFLIAMDPTWKMVIVGAIIASIAPTITGIFALVLQSKNKVTLGEIKHQTDGILGKMTEKADQAQTALAVATTRADQAEGEARGVASERARGTK